MWLLKYKSHTIILSYIRRNTIRLLPYRIRKWLPYRIRIWLPYRTQHAINENRPSQDGARVDLPPLNSGQKYNTNMALELDLNLELIPHNELRWDRDRTGARARASARVDPKLRSKVTTQIWIWSWIQIWSWHPPKNYLTLVLMWW